MTLDLEAGLSRAVFIDRDGTLNVEKNYLFKSEEFEFIPGAVDGVRKLQAAGFKVVVVTNQSGIARGYYGTAEVDHLHDFIQSKLREQKAHIDAFFYCPHHPGGHIAEFAVDCDCRKPKPGMLLTARKALGIDLENSYIVGDALPDMQVSAYVPVRPILVRTGHGQITEKSLRAGNVPVFAVCEDLNAAASLIISGEK